MAGIGGLLGSMGGTAAGTAGAGAASTGTLGSLMSAFQTTPFGRLMSQLSQLGGGQQQQGSQMQPPPGYGQTPPLMQSRPQGQDQDYSQLIKLFQQLYGGNYAKRF